MPIEFTCPHCQSLLRVEDANAGKRTRCPHCNVINRIPGERIDTTPPPPVSQQFFIESVSGQTYGPVTKTELTQWVAEGRVSAECAIRATGESTGRPASFYYPELAKELPATAAELPTASYERSDLPSESPSYPALPVAEEKPKASPNPYASPASTEPYSRQPFVVRDGIAPVQADLGEVFSRSWDVFTNNLGLLVGAGVVCGLLQLFTSYVDAATDNINGAGVPLAVGALLMLNLIQIYLAIGQVRISLKLIRGEHAEFSDLFSGGDKFFAVIGFTLLVIIPLLLGFLLLIVPGVFLMLFFWPSYMLIVDNKTAVFDSFGVAIKIGEKNLLNSFVIGLAGFGILVLGTLFCFVGYFFASAFVSVLWAMAYLMMSGQIGGRY